MGGSYSIIPIQVNITRVEPLDTISTDRQLLQTQSVQVEYTTQFLFPVSNDLTQPDAYQLMYDYYGNLTHQMLDNVAEGDFMKAFLYFLSLNGNSAFQGVTSGLAPVFFGPFLLTPLPTPAPSGDQVKSNGANSLNSLLLFLALIIGTVSGVLCLAALISSGYYYYYRKRISREDDMAEWAAKSQTADIEITKAMHHPRRPSFLAVFTKA
jgi:hypothetical protein